jgi:hypothetical protein
MRRCVTLCYFSIVMCAVRVLNSTFHITDEITSARECDGCSKRCAKLCSVLCNVDNSYCTCSSMFSRTFLRHFAMCSDAHAPPRGKKLYTLHMQNSGRRIILYISPITFCFTFCFTFSNTLCNKLCNKSPTRIINLCKYV